MKTTLTPIKNTPEKEGYTIQDREDLIDNLIMWINECRPDREHDKALMKEDLKMLMSWTCTEVYSSETTNDYIEIK